MVVYADVLFLINLAVNYLALLASAAVCGVPVRRLRMLAGALLGAVYSVLALLPEAGFLTNPFIKVAVGVLIALTAFGGREKLLRMVLVFFAVSALFGGVVLAVSLLGGGEASQGGIFTPVTLRVLMISFALSYIVLTLVFRRSASSRRKIQEAVIELDGRKVTVRALEDTGNALSEPLTGRPVMVAETEKLLPLFPEEIRAALSENIQMPATERFESVTRAGGKGFRLIPFTAVGTQRSMLIGFRPTRITVGGKEREATVVAMSPNPLGSGEYSAVINA